MTLIGSHVKWTLAVEYISYKIILLRNHLDDSELEGCDNGKSLNLTIAFFDIRVKRTYN